MVAHNTAPFGGGGSLFWQLWLNPARLGCPAGTCSANTSCPMVALSSVSSCILGTCVQCAPGTYQAQQDALECVQCLQGTYSESFGSVACSNCSSGTFSSEIGASSSRVCTLCSPGKFSESPALSSCSSCSEGSHAPGSGAEMCNPCEDGFFSGPQASSCSPCVTGVYAGQTYPSQHEISDFEQCPPLTAKNGTIGRLAPNGTYGNGELMFWVIDPVNASTLVLRFSAFNTTAGRGFVNIYKCLNSSCLASSLVLLGSFSVSVVPGPVKCPTGVLLVVWSSNGSTVGGGWSATYQSNGSSSLGARKIRRQDLKSMGLDVDTARGTLDMTRIAYFVDVQLESQLRALHKNMLLTRRQLQDSSSEATRLSASFRNDHVVGQQWLVADVKGYKQILKLPSGRASLRLAGKLATSRPIKHSPARYRGNLYVRSAEKANILSDICGVNNSALYGACIASGFEGLSVSISADSLYAGVTFNLTVRKLDAYGNTILSDSTSVLQAIADFNGASGNTASVSIVGSSLAQLTQGVAKFLLAIEPSFSHVDPQSETATLSPSSYLFFEGLDSESAAPMTSVRIQLNLQQGMSVCPAGYILVLSQPDATKGPAVCQMCKAGTYSLRQLAYMPGTSPTPSCINCPAGGVCTMGGDKVKFGVGFWTQVGGIYVLTSCPEGYALINSIDGTSKGVFSSDAQECKPCQTDQYILNPNNDTCQTCPPGLRCMGTSQVVPVIMNSTWMRNQSIYRLIGCPAGYYVSNIGTKGSFDATVQQCSPCPKGQECPLPPCILCSLCQPGFYKAAAGIDNCVPCPADTYSTQPGGQAPSDCQRCPLFGSTMGRVGQTSVSKCACDIGHYPAYASGPETLTCVVCPAGATCPDGTCALSRYSLVPCPGGSTIVGDWRLQNGTGLYALVGCPAGYYLNLDQCQLCPALYYCSGGTLPSTPCASGQFSAPGAASKENCTSAVFVYLVINLPILRLFFTDQTSSEFQSTLAYSANTNPSHVVVDIVQTGNDPRTTDVTSRIATRDPQSAAALRVRLSDTAIQSSFAADGFKGCSLMSVQVTACVPGYELQAQPPPSTCVPCPST